jgi:serine/threonine-protein kinase
VDENAKPAASRRRRIGFIFLATAILLLAVLSFAWWRKQQSISPESIPAKSVAVLPFQNLSDDPKNAFFAEGMQDEILTHLNKVADLRVISRSSVNKYRNQESLDLRRVSNDLRVRYFLEGSVQRAGERVRVSARLVDGLNGAQLSAADYDRDLADVFRIQTEIAERIVSALAAKFTPEEKAAMETRPTSDLAAYELYVRAKSTINRVAFESSGLEDLPEAAQLLQEAVTRDPSFYLAYCQLAWAHDQIYFYGLDRTVARLNQASTALDWATRLHPDFGETHLAAAVHAYYGYRDYDRARTELAQAERKLPNDPYPTLLVGYIDRRQGHWESSTAHFKRALQLDPRNLVFLKQLAHNFHAEHRYDAMRNVLDRALSIVPDDSALQVQRAAIDFDEHGDTASMEAAIQAALQKDAATGPLIADQWFSLALCKSDASEADRALAVMRPNGAYEDGMPFPKSWCEGLIARLRGDEAAARTAFTQAREEVMQMTSAQPNFAEGLSVLGLIEAALGEKEQAIADGKRAVELLPTTKDAIVGPLVLRDLAAIYSWTGENDAALRELQAIVSRPSYLSYGMLMHHPFWAPLRNDPNFQKIVTSLAPSA